MPANVKETKATKDTKDAKPAVPKLQTIAHFVYAFGDEGRTFKSPEDMATAILVKFKAIGQTKTIKGKELTPANVTSLITALTKDVVNQRPGVWSKYKVAKDDESGFQLVKRA